MTASRPDVVTADVEPETEARNRHAALVGREHAPPPPPPPSVAAAAAMGRLPGPAVGTGRGYTASGAALLGLQRAVGNRGVQRSLQRATGVLPTQRTFLGGPATVVDKPVEANDGYGLEKAEKVEPPEITPADAAKAGAQLHALEAAVNRPDTTDPDAVRASIQGISGFLGNLPATGGAKAKLISAATEVKNADVTLKTIKHRREMLGVVVSGAEAVVAAVKKLAKDAKEPTAGEPGKPPPERTHLTLAEAAQLNATVVAGSEFAKRELGKKQPQYGLVIGRLTSVKETLMRFGAPAAVQTTLSRYGSIVERMILIIKALSSDEKQVRATARIHLRTAITALRDLQSSGLNSRYQIHFR